MSRCSDTDTDLILCTSKLDSSWSCLSDIQERTLITLNLIVSVLSDISVAVCCIVNF